MYIPIILGTARKGNRSDSAADFILKEALNYGLESEIINVKDYLMGATQEYEESEKIKALSEKIEKADGLIVVSPEYNHGYPGELKLLLDNFYTEYAKKPVGLCGVSKGALGGARVVEQLRLVFIEFRMTPIKEAIYFSFVQDLFDGQGNIKDAALYSKKISKFMEELLWYAKVLKKGREENK